MSELDLALWGCAGTWIFRTDAEGSEPLCEVKHAANAENLACDHNDLVVEVERLEAENAQLQARIDAVADLDWEHCVIEED